MEAACLLVAGVAGESEVARDRFPTVLIGNNVIDVEWQSIPSFGHSAVFTNASCAFPDHSLESGIHAVVTRDAMEFRAKPGPWL